MSPIEVSAVTTAVAHAISAAKILIDARDQSKRADAQMEFTQTLIEVQEKSLSLIQSNQELLVTNESLKQQLADNEKWEQEQTRYVLENVGNGATVYSLDPEKASGQPLHWLCPNCFEDRKKSMLQRTGKTDGILASVFKCNRCKSEVIAQRAHPSPKRDQAKAKATIMPPPPWPPGPPPRARPR